MSYARLSPKDNAYLTSQLRYDSLVNGVVHGDAALSINPALFHNDGELPQVLTFGDGQVFVVGQTVLNGTTGGVAGLVIGDLPGWAKPLVTQFRGVVVFDETNTATFNAIEIGTDGSLTLVNPLSAGKTYTVNLEFYLFVNKYN